MRKILHRMDLMHRTYAIVHIAAYVCLYIYVHRCTRVNFNKIFFHVIHGRISRAIPTCKESGCQYRPR